MLAGSFYGQAGGESNILLSEKKKVFIVDNDASVCRAFKTLLTTFNFKVKTFLSANHFFDAVPDDEPGCLVLDIHMPGTDGWVMLNKILKSGSKRPVIFVSAEKNDGAAKRALEAGAAGFIQKPVNGQTLVDFINRAFENADKKD